MFTIFKTKSFEKKLTGLPKAIINRFESYFKKLEHNPFGVGKYLQGRIWFREIKIEKWRFYYLIFNEQVYIIFVAISSKKNQQKVIDEILKNTTFKDFNNLRNTKNDGDKK